VKRLLILCLLLSGCGMAAREIGDAKEVAHEELGVRASLDKYEWFKDAAATIDKKQADIIIYESRIIQMEEMYADTHRKDWPREDREQYNLWSTEVTGVRASYNSLAAEYNANMSKANWAYAEVGQLPEGAETPLPREFKPYES
jgi:hypothetical protein